MQIACTMLGMDCHPNTSRPSLIVVMQHHAMSCNSMSIILQQDPKFQGDLCDLIQPPSCNSSQSCVDSRKSLIICVHPLNLSCYRQSQTAMTQQPSQQYVRAITTTITTTKIIGAYNQPLILLDLH